MTYDVSYSMATGVAKLSLLVLRARAILRLLRNSAVNLFFNKEIILKVI